MTNIPNIISQTKRIIIKIGATNMVDIKTGNFNTNWLNNIVDEIVELKKSGKEIIIVSSGAVALGCNVLGFNYQKIKISDKQAASSIGQIELMQRYQESFSRYNIQIAQIVLTIEDIENRKRYLSARNVMDQLLSLGVIPIVNQNDVIATAEIRFGDNDRLSARVAQIANCNLLVLLSNVDGLYTCDPLIDKNAEFIKEVYEVNSEIERMATDSPTGSGGMNAKVAAAKIAVSADCNVAIINGKKSNHILKDLMEAGKATWFLTNVETHLKYIKE